MGIMCLTTLSKSLLLVICAILISAEPHDSSENTQDNPEKAQNDKIFSAELEKSNGSQMMSLKVKKDETYAKLISNEIYYDTSNEAVAAALKKVDKNDTVNLKNFVLVNKYYIMKILNDYKEGKKVEDTVTMLQDNIGSTEVKSSVKMLPQIKKSKDDEDRPEAQQYLAELKAGNRAENFGTNPHSFQAHAYNDLGRRHSSQTDSEEVNAVQEAVEDTHLEPKLASPEFVLDIAKKSALLEASKPNNPTVDIVENDILRSGNYWNSVWKEDANPSILRSNPSKSSSSLGIVKTQINPGSKLYELVKKISGVSPRLIYVINNL